MVGCLERVPVEAEGEAEDHLAVKDEALISVKRREGQEDLTSGFQRGVRTSDERISIGI